MYLVFPTIRQEMNPQIVPIITKNPIHGLPDFDTQGPEDVFQIINSLRHSQALDRFNLHRAKLSLAHRYVASMYPYIHPQQNTRSRLKAIRAYVK